MYSRLLSEPILKTTSDHPQTILRSTLNHIKHLLTSSNPSSNLLIKPFIKSPPNTLLNTSSIFSMTHIIFLIAYILLCSSLFSLTHHHDFLLLIPFTSDLPHCFITSSEYHMYQTLFLLNPIPTHSPILFPGSLFVLIG
jgi:hypothetical protein